MMHVRKRVIIAGLLACIRQAGSAEVACVFDTLSTIKENIGLDGYEFRVRWSEGELVLEQLFADGVWYWQGSVQRFDRPGFIVFLHLPNGGYELGRSQMLTIHQSGRASLAIHHGAMGNTSQIRRAWLYHGECTDAR